MKAEGQMIFHLFYIDFTLRKYFGNELNYKT